MMFTKTLRKKLLTQAAVFAAPLVLLGCSSVPDAVNPVEWYRSSVEYFSDDTPEQEKPASSEMAESGEAAPAAPQKTVGSGFVADKSGGREYAQPVMRQGEVVNALGEEKPVEVATQPPAPVAAPSSPVLTKPLETAQAQNTGESDPAMPKFKLNVPQTSTSQPVAPVMDRSGDNRSIDEIYAANIAQTRPTLTTSAMRGSDTLAYGGGYQYETVVVSGSGIDRQGPSYMQQNMPQFASLSQGYQSDVSETYSSAMMIEPAVVSQGQAQSLSRFNPAMFNGSFQVATIQFGNGSANLTAEDLRILQEVVNIHRQQGGVIRVVGHASSRTRDMSPEQHETVNLKMSAGRADKVARELLRLGMDSESLFVGGVSDQQPIYQEVMPSGEAGNRRTEIFVDY